LKKITNKVTKTSKLPAPDRGGNKMFGKGHSGTQKPGQSASMGRSGGGKGGNASMFGKGSAKKATPK
jgi:hypothetical protein